MQKYALTRNSAVPLIIDDLHRLTAIPTPTIDETPNKPREPPGCVVGSASCCFCHRRESLRMLVAAFADPVRIESVGHLHDQPMRIEVFPLHTTTLNDHAQWATLESRGSLCRNSSLIVHSLQVFEERSRAVELPDQVLQAPASDHCVQNVPLAHCQIVLHSLQR